MDDEAPASGAQPDPVARSLSDIAWTFLAGLPPLAIRVCTRSGTALRSFHIHTMSVWQRGWGGGAKGLHSSRRPGGSSLRYTTVRAELQPPRAEAGGRRGVLLGGSASLGWWVAPQALAYKAPPRNEPVQFERLDNGLRTLVLREGKGKDKGASPAVGDKVSAGTRSADPW